MDSASRLSPKGTFRFSRCNLLNLLPGSRAFLASLFRSASLDSLSGFLPTGVFVTRSGFTPVEVFRGFAL